MVFVLMGKFLHASAEVLGFALMILGVCVLVLIVALILIKQVVMPMLAIKLATSAITCVLHKTIAIIVAFVNRKREQANLVTPMLAIKLATSIIIGVRNIYLATLQHVRVLGRRLLLVSVL